MRATVRLVGVFAAVAYFALSVVGSAQAQNNALRLGPTNTNTYVTFGNPAKLGSPTFSGSFTVETWFRRQGAGVGTSTGTGGFPGTTFVPLVTKGAAQAEGSNVDAHFDLGINTVGNVIAADFEEGPGGAGPLGQNHPISGVTPIQNNVWYHVAATYDGTTWRLYLNGELEAERYIGYLPRFDSIQHAALGTTIRSDGTTVAGFFDGTLDEARIWNVARTAVQIRANINVQNPVDASLIARWGLDDGAGTTVGDSVAPVANGTVTNTNFSWVAGAPFDIAPCANVSSSMIRFSAPDAASPTYDDYVTFGAAPELGAATFTIETWFKREGAGVGNTTGAGGITVVPLIAKGAQESDGSNVDANYILGINTTGNVLAADFEDTASGGNHPVSGTTAIVNNNWYHAAATYDGTTWNLYLNGNLEATLAVGAFTPRFDSIQHAALGAMLNSTGGRFGALHGILDEARIWNVARSQAQIQADMFSQLTSGAGLLARWGMGEGAGTTVADSVGPTFTTGTFTNGPTWTASNSLLDASGACDDGSFCNGTDTCNGAAGGLRCAINAGDPCVGGPECADTCDEVGDSCNDVAGTACGSASDTDCDNPDTCNGAGSCSSNNEPDTTVCRPDAGECDVADYCDGAGSCDADAFESIGVPCGSASDTDCDNPDTCNGAGSCAANNEPGTTVCRPDAGECDVADYCDGTGTCDPDAFESIGVPCGSASDTDCDDPDTCNGGGSCSSNYEPALTPCGSPSDTACDDPDTCDGGGTCEPNVEPATTVCRPDAGDCDVEELCDGVGSCPSDVIEADGTMCDDGLFCTDADECTAGVCDGAPLDCSASGTQCRIGTCNETTDACEGPAKPDGTVCDDDDDCTIEDECTAGECGGQPDDLACLDHFSCYKSKTTLGFAPVAGITLVDAFWASTAEAKKPKWLCTPAAKNDPSSTAPSHPDHLESYQIKPAAKFAGATGVQLQDDLGTTTVTLTKPANLLVPTAKSLTSAPSVPVAPIVDNFQCYKVKVTSSSSSLPQIGVMVEDQFGEQTAELRKLKYACVPVNRGGTEPGAETHTGYLTCYQQKSLPKFVKKTLVYTANQIASETMDVIKPFVLCLPAAKLP